MPPQCLFQFDFRVGLTISLSQWFCTWIPDNIFQLRFRNVSPTWHPNLSSDGRHELTHDWVSVFLLVSFSFSFLSFWCSSLLFWLSILICFWWCPSLSYGWVAVFLGQLRFRILSAIGLPHILQLRLRISLPIRVSDSLRRTIVKQCPIHSYSLMNHWRVLAIYVVNELLWLMSSQANTSSTIGFDSTWCMNYIIQQFINSGTAICDDTSLPMHGDHIVLQPLGGFAQHCCASCKLRETYKRDSKYCGGGYGKLRFRLKYSLII